LTGYRRWIVELIGGVGFFPLPNVFTGIALGVMMAIISSLSWFSSSSAKLKRRGNLFSSSI
jgi:hypothetical protein